MALTTMIDAIVALVAAVPGVGKVYAYRRFVPDEKTQIDLFVADGILNCWFVRREATAARDIGPQLWRSRHLVSIEGFRAIESGAESEKAHQDLVEAIRASLDSNRALPSAAGWLREPVQVQQFAEAKMNPTGVTCWYAKLTVQCEETPMGGVGQ